MKVLRIRCIESSCHKYLNNQKLGFITALAVSPSPSLSPLLSTSKNCEKTVIAKERKNVIISHKLRIASLILPQTLSLSPYISLSLTRAWAPLSLLVSSLLESLFIRICPFPFSSLDMFTRLFSYPHPHSLSIFLSIYTTFLSPCFNRFLSFPTFVNVFFLL